MTIYHKGRATHDMTCVACDVERPAWRTDDHEQQAWPLSWNSCDYSSLIDAHV